MFDADADARLIVTEAGLDPDEPVDVLELAKERKLSVRKFPPTLLRGEDSLLYHPRGRAHPATIALRHGLTPKRKTWCIAHEIGEDYLQRFRYTDVDVESCADAIAAALLMPRMAFVDAVRGDGRAFVGLAEAFATEQTAVALRLAELGIVDASIVVSPRRIYVKSSGPCCLPTESELRRLARATVLPPGVAKVPITDAHKRVALLAEAG